MSTLNGIGTRFNGISKVDEQGRCTATHWFTFLYIPIIPLWRAEIKRDATEPYEFKYEIIRKIPLSFSDVLKTYLFGCIVVPFLLLFPFAFCTQEVIELLGLPISKPRNLIKGDGLNWEDWVFIFSIIYVLIFVLRLKAWDRKRGL